MKDFSLNWNHFGSRHQGSTCRHGKKLRWKFFIQWVSKMKGEPNDYSLQKPTGYKPELWKRQWVILDLLFWLPWRTEGLHPGHQLCKGFYYWVSLRLSHYGQGQFLRIKKQHWSFLIPRQGYGRPAVPLKIGRYQMETAYLVPLCLCLSCFCWEQRLRLPLR